MDITEFLQNIDKVVQKTSQEFHNLNVKYQDLLNKKDERYPIYFRGIGIKREDHKCDSSKDVVVFGIKGKRLEFERKKGETLKFKFIHVVSSNSMSIQQVMIENGFDEHSGSSTDTTTDGNTTVDDSSTTVVATSSSSDDVDDIIDDSVDEVSKAMNPSKW